MLRLSVLARLHDGIFYAQQFRAYGAGFVLWFTDEGIYLSTGTRAGQQTQRMTRDRVSRIISQIGQAAEIVVCQDDERTGTRLKYASAHDIRRGYAKRLIDVGVSAETIKVVMRHRDFATTEKHYGAIRSTQVAGEEVRRRLSKTD